MLRCFRILNPRPALSLAFLLALGLVLSGDWLAPLIAHARGGERGERGGDRGGDRGGYQAPRGNFSSRDNHGPGPGDRHGQGDRPNPGGPAPGPNPNYHPGSPPGHRPPPPPPSPGYRPPPPPPPPAYRPPPPPPYYRPGPHYYPVPPPPPYYYGHSNSDFATGVAIGALLTVLPATAVAISNSGSSTIYRSNTQCFIETYQGPNKVYKAIPCP